MEIERKYLVKTLPEHLEQYQSKKSHRDTCVRHRWYVSAAPTMIIISPIKGKALWCGKNTIYRSPKKPTNTCF